MRASGVRLGLVAAWCLGAAGCASGVRARPSSAPRGELPGLSSRGGEHRGGHPPGEGQGEVGTGALEGLRAALLARDPASVVSARALGVSLGEGAGERQLTGEPARDDRVASVDVVTHLATQAAVLVRTECGNAHLVALRWDGGAWSRADGVGLVTDAHPGGCRSTAATASARAVVSGEDRDLVVTFSSDSEEGDEARDPVLRVYHLTPEARLETLLPTVPFGGTDDVTGSARRAEWLVDDNLPPPRMLYVEIAPGHPGPGGSAPAEIIRRVYRLSQGRLRLEEEVTEALRAPGTR